MLGFSERLRVSATALKTTTDKKLTAMQEGVDLTDFITPQPIEVIQDPFPHVVVDNFFQPHFYESIESFMRSVLARGLAENEDHSRFHPFLELQAKGKSYDGYKYPPLPQEDPIFSLFFSISWNLFFSKLFNQPTGWGAELALHHHPPGNRTGFVHHDYALTKFSPRGRLPNGLVLNGRSTEHSGPPFYLNRILSLIYFAGNDPAGADVGGGTGLYAAQDGADPVKIVAPKNNRLLAFQISPKSFHAFQENKTVRNSIVQWFHVDPAWCEMKYGFAPKPS